MLSRVPAFTVRLAQSDEDLIAAQRLRYDVFVTELGGDSPDVDHANLREKDRFDDHADVLLLCDDARPHAPVVGMYRVMTQAAALAAGGFYSSAEYDLTPLLDSGRPLLELGRSCLHPDYRGSTGVYHLWQGLAQYVEAHQIEVLFGVASFHGTDPQKLAQPLSALYHRNLAPAHLRTTSRVYQSMNLVALDQIDRKRAALATPALIKAYLRLGGFVGDGAFVDHAFNTTDICLILDIAQMTDRQRALYSGARG